MAVRIFGVYDVKYGEIKEGREEDLIAVNSDEELRMYEKTLSENLVMKEIKCSPEKMIEILAYWLMEYRGVEKSKKLVSRNDDFAVLVDRYDDGELLSIEIRFV